MECVKCKRDIDQIIKEDGEVEITSGEPFMCNHCKAIEEHESWMKGMRTFFGVDKLEEENKNLKEQLKEKDAERLEYWHDYKYYKNKFLALERTFDQMVIKELENVKTAMRKNPRIAEDYFAVVKIIDQRINEIRGKYDDKEI